MQTQRSIPDDEKRKRQLAVFRQRVKPHIAFVTEGVVIKRGVRRRLVTQNPCEWSDTVYVEAPRMGKMGSLWKLFVENYGQCLMSSLSIDPKDDFKGFTQELLDLTDYLNRSTITPNSFRFVFERPHLYVGEKPVAQMVKGKEKFEREKYPPDYKLILKLVWKVKP